MREKPKTGRKPKSNGGEKAAREYGLVIENSLEDRIEYLRHRLAKPRKPGAPKRARVVPF